MVICACNASQPLPQFASVATNLPARQIDVPAIRVSQFSNYRLVRCSSHGGCPRSWRETHGRHGIDRGYARTSMRKTSVS